MEWIWLLLLELRNGFTRIKEGEVGSLCKFVHQAIGANSKTVDDFLLAIKDYRGYVADCHKKHGARIMQVY